MTANGSLFERLGVQRGGHPDNDREQSAENSVAAHLAKMLSTRAGSVQTLPDYGLPDLNDMSLSLHASLTKARLAIERFIEAYEPRLSSVKVISQENNTNPLKLAFVIEGLLEVDGIKHLARFSAGLDGSGKVTVK